MGSNVILSYIDIRDEEVPDNVVLHGLKQKNGSFVARIYGVDENPKGTLEENCSFLGTTVREFMEKNRITEEELWGNQPRSLWFAKLYPECEDIRTAIAAALNIYEMAQGRGDAEAWRSSVRKSLCEGFNEAEAEALHARLHEVFQDSGVDVWDCRLV